jgi:hypothetical protein
MRAVFPILTAFVFLTITVGTHAQKMFQSLPASQTNISFSNTVRETPDLNIIAYEYFYNGGGVALGDFNKDGLTDIYLTANILPARLYLNKGNWQFEDITAKAGVAGKRGWKTGASIADVNGDGYPDIYVCYSGPVERSDRTNQLFINNGDLTFTDRANQMGVADSGYTTQAVFFDYDRDNDLDLFVLNHNNKSFRNFDAAFVKKMVDRDAGDRLYRNDNNIFKDITLEAGIISNPLGYGLGIAVSDLNLDGWPDLYVSNDYVEEDYLYINNQNGTFTDKLKDQFGHLSNFSMGNDIADINNDGLPDIFTVDMLPADNKRQKLLYMPDNYELYENTLRSGFYHQLMRNMLQVNNGDGSFSETGQLSGVYCTDWSWGALFADFNNDGNKDLFVSNGYGRDMTNRDFVKFYANERLKYTQGKTSDNMFRMLQGIPVTPLHDYLFINTGDLQFRDSSAAYGFDEASLSQGCAYADLDNDGDLDLVINHLNAPAGVYRNMSVESGRKGNYLDIDLRMPGNNKFAIGAKVNVYSPSGLMSQENYPVRGFQSSSLTAMHIGLPGSAIDSIIVLWPDGKKQKLTTGLKANTRIEIPYSGAGEQTAAKKKNTIFHKSGRSFQFVHEEPVTNDFKVQPLMPGMISYNGPRMVKADLNGDKLDDIFICGARGQQAQLLLQSANGGFVRTEQKAFAEDAAAEDAAAIFFDADNDGDKDLYVVSGGFANADAENLQDRLYINDRAVFVKRKTSVPVESSSGSCVVVSDIDGDGDADLFVGGRVVPGEYPKAPESLVLINDGKGNFTNATASMAGPLQHIGMVTDAVFEDLNKDGKNELLICGEWMKLSVFEIVNGRFTDASSKYFDTQYRGWWNCITMADIDNDGDKDLIAGNLGLNSPIHASLTEPAAIYYNDFDNNGSVDPLICYYIQGKEYPMASRDEMTDQIVSLRQRFPTYDSYSEATIKDILSAEQLQSANRLEATDFETMLFENKNGKFVRRVLPVQANISPVYAVGTGDYDRDGNPDIVLAGNTDKSRIKIGRMDANYGVLLKGDGKGNFRYIPQSESGLSVRGCVRSVLETSNGSKKTIILGINNGNVLLYDY